MDQILVFGVMIMLGILSYYFYHVGSGNRYQEADQLDSQQVLTSEIQTEPNREEDEKRSLLNRQSKSQQSKEPKGELNGRIVLKTMGEAGARILVMVVETSFILSAIISN